MSNVRLTASGIAVGTVAIAFGIAVVSIIMSAIEEQQKPGDAPLPAGQAEGEEHEAMTEKPATEEEGPAAKEEEQEQLSDPEEPDDGVPRVLVTGASGYVATHIIQQLLEQGRVRVRGTVRSLKREEKVQPLRDLVPDAKYPLRLIEADLTKPNTWAKAVESCTYVYHVASPLPVASPGPSDVDRLLIRPAVEGTTTVLKACADAGTVKRVVLTGSGVAVSTGNVGNPGMPPDHVYTEEDWSHEPSCTPYARSKLLAEKAAWNFVKELEEDKRFELAVVNPMFVLGPLLSTASGESSRDLLYQLLEHKLPAVADISTGIVDVRDVAAAEIAAMEKLEAAGNRFLLVAETVTLQRIAQITSDEFKPQGYNVPVRVLPKALVWIYKFFSSEVRELYPLIGKHVTYNTDKMKRILGVQPRAIEETINDMSYSLIDFGIVHKTHGYLGHPSTRPQQVERAEPKEATGKSGGGEARGAESETKAEESSWETEAKAQGEEDSTAKD